MNKAERVEVAQLIADCRAGRGDGRAWTPTDGWSRLAEEVVS